MTALADALADAGGAAAPAAATAQLRGLVVAALRHGREELAAKRSGYGAPVEVAVGAHDGLLLAATPAAAAIGITAGELDQGFLVVGIPAPAVDADTLEELVPLAFDEQVEPVDRLRAAARAVPGSVLADVALREP